MAARDVVDPAGVRWNVRRRWYPWRRTMSFREILSNSPADAAAAGDTQPDADASSDSGSSQNFLLKGFLVALGAILWVLIGAGKLLVYAGAIVLFVVISLAELGLELIAMPVVLLLRLMGAARWPVQINRHGKHFATRYADDFAGATVLRDEVAGGIEQGTLPMEEPAAVGDPTS